MILFELLFLDSPYSEIENSYEITQNIIAGVPPVQPITLSPEYQQYVDLFQTCTASSPAARPTSRNLVEMIKQLPDKKRHSAPHATKPSSPAPLTPRAKEEEVFINPLYNIETKL
mmetsp:Transcript_4995/g.6085  ORF Transcript_4995/g.6085 Transcript_4995/m.6085 type:complete len:115 (-) Transcript_4995:7-351(-)